LAVISTDRAPAAIGPYSQARACGGLLFVFGQWPIAPGTGTLPGDAIDQMRQAIKNIAAFAEAAGTSLAAVMKTTVLVTDLSRWSELNAEDSRHFSEPYPARPTNQVAALPMAQRLELTRSLQHPKLFWSKHQMNEKHNGTVMPPRIQRLRNLMEKQGLDAIVSFKPENSFYMTGFNPIIYSHPLIAILVQGQDPILLVHALRDDHSRASALTRDIRLYGRWSTKVTMGAHWEAALASILADLGVADGAIGIEEDFISVGRFNQLISILPEARFGNASPLINTSRLVKDPDEIANSRVAGKIADIGMNSAIDALAAGGTERDIALAGMQAMNREWADNYPDVEVCDFGSLEGGVQNGLWTWALSGPRMFYNCDNPTQRKPQQGELVSVLIWSIANGMHAENERTVAVGEVSDENRRALQAVLEIREEVDAMLKPGTRYCDLFEGARRGLEARGYGDYIPGRIGHGIGLGAHEQASLDATTEYVLEPGTILAFEPNIRVPGISATQISDTVLITESGREYITRSVGGYLQV
jgi:Xaa-Pro dipeptidase